MNEACDPKGTVVIVDDDGPVRESLAFLLSSAGFATRCHDCGQHLLDCGPPGGPACLVLDLEMPGMNGCELQQRLAYAHWEIPIIFLTGRGDVAAAVKALKNGAVDFLEKDQLQPSELLERVEQCIKQHREAITKRESRLRLRRRFDHLTGRELEVANRASAGMTNKVIGLELGISERTVEIHRGRAMKKLGLRTAADLARLESLFDELTSGEAAKSPLSNH